MINLFSDPGIVINFPVQPHVYKYLQSKVGESMTVSKHTLWGNIVLDILSKKHCDLKHPNHELTYPVHISMKYVRDYGVYLNENTAGKFNKQINRFFREEMRTFVFVTNANFNVPKDECLRRFLNHFNISEDDIKFETLKKDLIRNIADEKK